jgi:hypothetical protein
MGSTQTSVPTHKDRNHRSYAIREWRCIDGELTCLRAYVPYERREEPERSQQSDWLTVNAEAQGGKKTSLAY